jgi:hypothetical protein
VNLFHCICMINLIPQKWSNYHDYLVQYLLGFIPILPSPHTTTRLSRKKFKSHSPFPFPTTFNHFPNACKWHFQLFDAVHDSCFQIFCLNLNPFSLHIGPRLNSTSSVRTLLLCFLLIVLFFIYLTDSVE